MSPINLSKRLAAVAQFVPQDSIVADIGSDHAYLPIWLTEQKRLKGAIAGEVVAGPFESTQTHVIQWHLEDQIQVRLGDGVEVLNPEEDQVTCIVIAGMGGLLITEILECGLAHLNGHERLVLQPNIMEPTVREWLMKHHYAIVEEAIVAEDGHIYEVIVGEPRTEAVELDEADLVFGPVLRRRQPADFQLKWSTLLNKKRHLLVQLQGAQVTPTEKIATVQHEIQLIEEVQTWDN